jgi:hypothetical protein
MRRVRLVLVLLGLAGCAGTQTAGAPVEESTNAYVKLPAVSAGLAISTTDLTTDGRFAKVRGRVTNPHAQTVDGIRYLVRIETRGDQPRTLDRFQYDTTERVEAGQAVAMRLDIESMYLSTANQLAIIALPKKLGEQPVPVPLDWQ